MRLAWLACLLVARLAANEDSLSNRLDAARQLKTQGKLAVAANAYASLLPALREAPDRPLYALALLEASDIALSTGQYGVAESDAEESAKLFGELKDRRREALAIDNGGRALLYRGDYAGALERFRRVLAVDVAEHQGEGEVTVLNNIANVFFFQGKYTEALENYERALARVDATGSEPWNPNRRQLTLANLATLYEQLGLNQKGLEYYQAAQAYRDAIPPGDQAQLLSSLGMFYRRLGDRAKALETYQTARELFARQQPAGGQTHILQNIGIAQALDYGDLARAFSTFTEALHMAESEANQREVLLARLYRAETLFRMDRAADARQEWELALAGAREISALDVQWTAQYGLGRIARRAGDRLSATEWFRQAIATIESERSGLGMSSLKAEFLSNQRNVFDSAIELLLETKEPDPEQLFDLLEQARSRNLPDRLRQILGRTSIATVQQKLQHGSLLVEYWLGARSLAAFWMANGRSGWVSRTVTAQDLESIRALVAALPESRDSAWKQGAAQVGELLLAGLPREAGIRQLLIVPDGILSYLPFELLPAPGSGDLLVERYAISYLPSTALLLRNREASDFAFPWRTRFLAMGDPIVPVGGPLENGRPGTRLPAADAELLSVSRALQGSSQILEGSDDLKRHLSAGPTGRAPILHLSTPATLDLGDPMRSRILFTPEAGNPGSEYLFWPEVQSLPLAGVELVTLSACDTEGGKMVRGEGIQSFSRAFLSAGAASTVTTLWRVGDAPAAEFMRLFYSHLSRGEPLAEALRSAKLSFLGDGSELAQPRFWAAFVLNGDGQKPLEPLLSWWWVVLPAAFGLTLAIFLYRSHRLRRPKMR